MSNSTTIEIDLSWRGADDATRLEWRSDDLQGWIDGGSIEMTRSVESQAEEFKKELESQGLTGGTIGLTR